MAAISVRLPEDLKTRLAQLAERTGRSKTYYMVEAIKEHIGDLEDFYIAEQRLIERRAGRSKSYTRKRWKSGMAWRIEYDQARKRTFQSSIVKSHSALSVSWDNGSRS
jgi:RHH-type rel operon transcriptional repressor/antitoxin RelB